MSFLSYPRTKTRPSIKRRPSETLIRKSLAVSQSFLSPSINPVRRSIEATPNSLNEFTIHYHRKNDSTKTIDSRHEAYYEKYGFPIKPKYNPRGRRFSDSTETDPDYNAIEFRKLTKLLNNKESPLSSQSGSPSSSRRSSASSNNSQSQKKGKEDPSMNSLLAELEKIQTNRSDSNNDDSKLNQNTPIDLSEIPRDESPSCFKSFVALMRQWFSCKGFTGEETPIEDGVAQAPNLTRTTSFTETVLSTKKYTSPRGTNLTNPKQDTKKNPPSNIKPKKKSAPYKRFPSLVTPSVTGVQGE